jgi:hypothetical protein
MIAARLLNLGDFRSRSVRRPMALVEQRDEK